MASERRTSRGERKATGVFYTPEYIVKYILEQTLAKHDVVANPTPKVLDPACGSGNFLAAAYDLLLRKFVENLPMLHECYAAEQYIIKNGLIEICLDGHKYWCRENLHYHIISQCLYGADVDEEAVHIAQSRLLEKDLGQIPGSVMPNLVICDSLIKWEENQEVPDNASNNESIRTMLADFWIRKYDYVIGNPPYISFGLNRVGKISAAHSSYLRITYPNSAQYKLSYYALFFERSILALKAGGYLGFITPDSYLLGRYYSKIREFILDTCIVQELTLVHKNVFSGVLVGIPAITILQKNHSGESASAVIITVNKLSGAGAVTATYQYGQEYFDRQVYKRFRLFFHEQDKAIVDKLDQAAYRLGDISKIRTGMRSLTVQADIKSKTKQGGTWQQGLVSSAQVLPFCLNYHGDWLDVNPTKLNKGGWDKDVMTGSKIFLRQTGDSLIAAVDRSGYYHLNNIHSLAVLDDGIAIEYLMCILNSRLMNFYYQTVTLERGRSMAQVDIEMVEKLPLIIDEKRASLLCRIGGQLAEIGGYGAVKEGNSLYNELNKVVYEIYGLSESAIMYIEQTAVNDKQV